MPEETEQQNAGEGSEGTPPPPPADADAPPVETEGSPAPAPEPEPEPEVDRFAALEARLAASEERERKYLEMLERQQQPKPPQPQEEPEPDIEALIREHTAEDERGLNTRTFLTKLTAAIEKRVERKHRREVEPMRLTTAQMAQQQEDQQVQAELRARKIPDADIAEAKKRIHDWAQKHPNQYNPDWPNAKIAYKDMLADIQQERLYGEADKAAAKKQNVAARQQRQVQPIQSEPPAGSGKVELDVKKWRSDFVKTHGRRPTTDELLQETLKTGA